MNIKKVLLDPNPKLRAENRDLLGDAECVWLEIEHNVKRMFKVMREFRGVGLAAPQVGWNVRLFVMNANTHATDGAAKPITRKVYWNPRIEVSGEPALLEEGCLSLPKVYGKILRYPTVKLFATTPSGPDVEIHEGYDAQIIQHEVGHLDGKLCFDNFASDA
jgi:peptide deformylase